MPNPLVPSFPQVRRAMLRAGLIPPDTHKLPPPVDQEGQPITEPVQPETEGRPPYNPYRGGEMHGVVAPVALEDDAEGFNTGTVAVHYSDEPPEHVLPVRIVPQTEAETMTAWRAVQSVAPVTGDRPPVQVIPRNRQRTKAKLQNLSVGDGVWIGPDTSVSAQNGWFVKPGDSVDLSTTEEVYAVSATATAVPLAVLVEYSKSA